jgi:hypothetical protein
MASVPDQPSPHHDPPGLAELRSRYGEHWQVWIVRRVYGGTVWCSRRWDWQPGGVILNAASAAELAAMLEEQASR